MTIRWCNDGVELLDECLRRIFIPLLCAREVFVSNKYWHKMFFMTLVAVVNGKWIWMSRDGKHDEVVAQFVTLACVSPLSPPSAHEEETLKIETKLHSINGIRYCATHWSILLHDAMFCFSRFVCFFRVLATAKWHKRIRRKWSELYL